MFYLCYLYSFIYTGVQHDFTPDDVRRVSHVGQELLTLPEHLKSSRFLWDSCCSIFSFMCMFCGSLFVLLTIVLSVLLRCMACIPFIGNHLSY